LRFHVFNFRQAEEILNSKKKNFDEIQEIIKGLTLTPWQEKDHTIILQSFESKGWSREEKISEDLEKAWRYDAYNERIAIEVNTKSLCHRSYLKFILGYNAGKIDVGVIIVYDETEVKDPKRKIYSITQRELKDLRTIIPVPILLMGIYP